MAACLSVCLAIVVKCESATLTFYYRTGQTLSFNTHQKKKKKKTLTHTYTHSVVLAHSETHTHSLFPGLQGDEKKTKQATGLKQCA